MAQLPIAKVLTSPHVYFDDAGCNPKHEPLFVWAGYYASYSFWNAFGKRWNKVLDRPPRLPYWQLSSARARAGPFQVLTEAQQRRRELSLSRLIQDNLRWMTPVAVVVSNAEIAAHVAGKIKCSRPLTAAEHDVVRPDLMERPHFIALAHAMEIVVHAHPPGLLLPVSIHCENRELDPYQDHIQRVWKLISKYDPRMGTMAFLPGKTRLAPQLQAADVLAWHVNYRAKHPGESDDWGWTAIGGTGITEPFWVTTEGLKNHVATWNAFPPL